MLIAVFKVFIRVLNSLISKLIAFFSFFINFNLEIILVCSSFNDFKVSENFASLLVCTVWILVNCVFFSCNSFSLVDISFFIAFISISLVASWASRFVWLAPSSASLAASWASRSVCLALNSASLAVSSFCLAAISLDNFSFVSVNSAICFFISSTFASFNVIALVLSVLAANWVSRSASLAASWVARSASLAANWSIKFWFFAANIFSKFFFSSSCAAFSLSKSAFDCLILSACCVDVSFEEFFKLSSSVVFWAKSFFVLKRGLIFMSVLL